jgi:hypothetical protein
MNFNLYRHQSAERLRARQTGPDGAAPSGSARLCDGTNWTLLKTRNYADHRFEDTGHPALLQIWKERQR